MMAILVAIINSTYDTSLNSIVAGLASVLAEAPKVCVQLRLNSVSRRTEVNENATLRIFQRRGIIYKIAAIFALIYNYICT